MPLRLDIQRKLSNRSARVKVVESIVESSNVALLKAVDFHPTEPWLLTALYTGNVHIWNYESQAMVKTIEASELPLRACKFISRKSWIVTGSDDMMVKVFNYNTHEKVASFEAHVDYIRSVAVHPTQPLVLTSSDDMTIKLWDWEKGWKNVMTFEGHTHFVMHVVFNPKDGNTFASASMDRTLKVWSLSSPVANYTLEGHLKGVNCVEYYEGGDKPYLVSGADDKLIKVWDYQNKTCVQTLEGHTNNVMRVSYHPSLPIIISGSEDGTIRIWHANTYRLENTLNYGMERVWCLSCLPGSNDVAFGYDEGTVSIKLGREEPSVSMDNTGKVVWAKQNEIQTVNIQQIEQENVKDGEKIVLPVKDLGSCEIYPQSLVHSPNGRFTVVCGDGEFIIYTALAWRNKSFGQALEFVWAQDSNEYAIRESTSRVKLFRSFKEKPVNLKIPFSAEGIFGGNLLAIKSNSFIVFYDWESGVIVRRVDVSATNVFWSETGLVSICTSDSFYVLRFNGVAFQAHLEAGHVPSDEGFEDVLDFVTEVPESIQTGSWTGDCLIYTNTMNRLNYFVGGQISTISHFDKPMYLLGFIPRDNRIYVCDKHLNISSYSLPLCVIEYQTAVLRGDVDGARSLLSSIPVDHRNRIARFLEGQGLKSEAISVTSDPEHKFELAMQLSDLGVAFEIASTLKHDGKWKSLGDAALSMWNYGLALECWKRANDLESVLLMYQTSGNAQGIAELASIAHEKGEYNIAFICNFLLSNIHDCIQLLIETNRIPEAALFARTYAPSQVSRVVSLWKQSLAKGSSVKMADQIADPTSYENLFADFRVGLEVEQGVVNRSRDLAPASAYSTYAHFDDVDLVSEVKNGKSLDELFASLDGMSIAVPKGVPSVPKSPPKSASPVHESVVAAAPRTVSRTPSPERVSRQPSPQLPSASVSPVKDTNNILGGKRVREPRAVSPAPSPPKPVPSAAATTGHSTSLSPASAASIPKNASSSPKRSSSIPSRPSSPVHQFQANKLGNGGPVKTESWDGGDNMSHLSMEVNTTGTGSVRDESVIESHDFDDFGGDDDASGAFDPNAAQLNDEELEEMLG